MDRLRNIFRSKHPNGTETELKMPATVTTRNASRSDLETPDIDAKVHPGYIMEDGGLKRRPVNVAGTAFVAMCFSTLGVIYSDIGTSPLYVLNGIWPPGPAPVEEDVIGGVSAIFWALTILPLLKYVLISLRFGTMEGEGGTFALLNGLFPRHDSDELDRSLTQDSLGARSDRDGIRGRRWLDTFKWPLTALSLFGTALTLGDGIFTPAVSVTSAVSGVALAESSVSKDIVPISIAFLVLIFGIQRFGTGVISRFFAPVTFCWLVLLAGTGIANITQHPGIFRAIDPSRAVLWFVRTGEYDYLAGVLLAITGCEAMFANLGQFNARTIQITFACFVYPCLVLAYLGQGARIIVDGDSVMSNIFFATIPGKTGGALYWIIYVFSILATLIASQALITATFSLTQQLINMKSLPPLRLVYTSSLVQGQVYVPFANYVLGIACLIVVGVFQDLTNLTNAYGFAVATVMIVTTTFLAIQIFCIKHGPLVLSIGFFLVFGFFDGLFFGASLKKVPHGAWVPLMIGCILTMLMLFWTWARGLEDRFDGQNRKNPRHFIVPHAWPNPNAGSQTMATSSSVSMSKVESNPALRNRANSGDELELEQVVPELPDNEGHIRIGGVIGISGGEPDLAAAEKRHAVERIDNLDFIDETSGAVVALSRLPTCAIFHKLTAGKGVPHSFYGFLKQMPALPKLVVFLSVKVVPIAHMPKADAYQVTRVRSIPGFFGVTYCLGFRDDFEPSLDEILRLICDLEARATQDATIVAEYKRVAQNTTHIIPHYHVVSKPVKNPVSRWVRQILIEEFYRRLSVMFPETSNWRVDEENILRVGVNAPI